jgi:hypothetical protein
MMSGRQAFLWFVVGAVVCVGWAYVSTRAQSPVPDPASSTTAPALAPADVAGAWSSSTEVKSLGVPLLAHVTLVFASDGGFTQSVRLTYRDGEPVDAGKWNASGTWKIERDALVVTVDRPRGPGKPLKLQPYVNEEGLIFIAGGTDVDLVSGDTFRRDATTQPAK